MRTTAMSSAAVLLFGAALLSSGSARAAERTGRVNNLALAKRIVDVWFSWDRPETREAIRRSAVLWTTTQPQGGTFAPRVRNRFQDNTDAGIHRPNLWWKEHSGVMDLALTAQGPAVLEYRYETAKTTAMGLEMYPETTAQHPLRLVRNKLTAMWMVWQALRRSPGRKISAQTIDQTFAGYHEKHISGSGGK